MIKTVIVDGFGNGNKVRVNGEGEINVVTHAHPPVQEKVQVFPYRAYFTTAAGASDMRVNGSTTNVDFCVRAIEDRDIWLKTISIRISDGGAKLNLFGALAALTNGVELSYSNQSLGKVVIHEGLKTNLMFMRLGTSSHAIGGADAYKADLTGSGGDTYLPIIDLSVTFGLPYGLRLVKETKDNICFKIRDNLSSGMDTFDAIGYGIQI